VTSPRFTSSVSGGEKPLHRPPVGHCTFGQEKIALTCPFGQWVSRPGKKVREYPFQGVLTVVVLPLTGCVRRKAVYGLGEILAPLGLSGKTKGLSLEDKPS
jgi:hypothetical protein